MEIFEEYLDTMGEPEQRDRMEEILNWVKENYPNLGTRIAWSQPMFTDHGTYIIGFSHSTKHISMSPEVKPMKKFKHLIEETGLSHTKNIIRVQWSEPIPYELMETLIEYNLEDKADHTKFWR